MSDIRLRKVMLTVNGVDRMIVFDPGRDTLAEALRRFGLTGVKVGCGAGQCGACSVIVNGKVVRSCMKQMKDIEEFSTIETIEGLGVAGNLHPLQQAWITYGAVQCGFCTPGFIMSAKALLDSNPAPSREDVRDWFQKNRNVCRCTGYKPIVDAVMEAAKVMRGEKSIEDIVFKTDQKKGVYNSRLPRPAALGKVLGITDYGDDIKHKMPPETLHVAVIQPRITSHANIVSIDYSEAEKMDGVVKVVTAKDVKGTNRIIEPLTHPRATLNGTERPIFMDKKIFRYGDIVGAVAADTQEHARAAAGAVKVKIEPLPEYMNYLDAAMPGAVRIHGQSPNIYLSQPLFKGGDTRDVISGSYCSVEGSFHTAREPHLSVEGDTMQAYWDEDGNMVIHCKTQSIEWNRMAIADGMGMPPDKVRLVENATGGSFGWATCAAGYAMMGVCLMSVNKPLTCTLTYEEHQHFSGKRTPAYINGRMSCDEEGKLTALEFDAGVDHGAYNDVSDPLIDKFIRYNGFPYHIPNVRGLARFCTSNHNFGTSYRGFGSPQSYTCSESLIDMLAEKMGMDPFEFRYKNVARPGDLTINSRPYRDVSMVELMDMVRPYYYEAKERLSKLETAEKAYGVGISCGGFNVTTGAFDHAEVALELNPDGKVTNYNTWEDQGQGGDVGTVAHTCEALRPLGIQPDQVRLMMNDSHRCPNTGIAAASRSHFMAGNAIIDAANQLMDAMKKDDGTFRTYDEMIAGNIPVKYVGVYDTAGTCEELDPNTGEGDPVQTVTYGVFMAEVEIDKATGQLKVLREVVAADVGVLGNKLSVEGQAYGGISHTIGYALKENYDDLKKHGTLAGAGVPYILDIPDDIELLFLERKRNYGPFGSVGCSELFQSSGHVAVLNAIHNAAGVRIYELPASKEKIRAAMEAKAQGKELKQGKYFLGSDLYDALEDLINNPV